MRPRVTIIVTQRECMSLTARSLDSILSDRSEAFDLIYVEGGSPLSVREYLQTKSAEEAFRLIQHPTFLWPNVARNLALPYVTTEYVVFIDNDVLIEQGWLERLVRAADETGAAMVGPLYLWSDGTSTPRIHMAGGRLTIEGTPSNREIFEQHERINESLEGRASLVRTSCDYLEYHCMLVRTDFLKELGGLDENIVCLHEHIDIALEARKRNLLIILEPDAAVDYLAFAPFAFSDLAFYNWRWSATAVSASLKAFCEKWGAVENGASMKPVHQFAAKHRNDVNVFAPGIQNCAEAGLLNATDVRQTIYSLLTQAYARGYSPSDILLFGKAYNAATTLFGDGYRPCGRPFLLHVVGTASVLVAFGFSARVVVSSLLHAAYSHAPVGSNPMTSLDAVKQMLVSHFGTRVEQTVRAYTRLQSNPKLWCDERPFENLTLADAELIAMTIANAIDEHFAGEFVFTDKRLSEASGETAWKAYAGPVANGLDIPALALTLTAASNVSAPEGFLLRRKFNSSFRQFQGASTPMTHPHFGQWDNERNGPGGTAAGLTRLAG